MDGLSGAASVLAVIDMSAKIASLCSQYSIAVKNARSDIELIQKKLSNIKRVLESIKKLLEGPYEARLSTAHSLFKSLEQCLLELQKLEEELGPSKTRKAMSKFGIRAFKWPFTSKQVEKIVARMDSYEHIFTLALQVDQTGLVLGIDQKLDLATQDTHTLHQKLDLNALPIAIGAAFDSYNEEHNARCLPHTRSELLDEIRKWARKKDGKCIFWLSGMAGTGKSTIARTIAQSFASDGQLGASFFFKKGENERSNASRFFTTVATDLAAYEPGVIPGIQKALNEDLKLAGKSLKEQFEKLIMQPLLEMKQARPLALPRVVVIDALDECERETDIRAILQLLVRAKDIQPVPLRIVVTSRPELHIRLGFREMPNGTYQDLLLHEVPRPMIERDIRLFLKHEFDTIRKKHTLSADWPATAQIQDLVELAVPLFLYAATVCRYVGADTSDPEEYLVNVLQRPKFIFSPLDQLYSLILNQLFAEKEERDKEPWLHVFRELVGSIVILESPLSTMSLTGLLHIRPSQVHNQLKGLHSVLNVPNDESRPVQMLHLSFREFLVDPQKQGKSPFWVDEKSAHGKLASRCLELMSRPGSLHRNMCGLSGVGVLRSEIEDSTVASNLKPELQYACRYWVSHLIQSQQYIVDGDTTHLFLQKHLLHWLEAMSLMRESSRCVHLLNSLERRAYPPHAIAIESFLYDARRFVLRFQYTLADAPLQIYCSAIIFAPEKSIIRQTFEHQLPQEVRMVSMRESDWNACRSTLEGHSHCVTAVAFSPDGQLVASASHDTTVRLWDVATGTCRSILEGHSSSVMAICFSPDGQLVISASDDHTVRLWNAITGTCHRILEGHSGPVDAICFSLDGQLVKSVSTDNTVRVWEVATGICRSAIEYHISHYLGAVAFSPDRQLIASESNNNIIQICEAATGKLHCLLGGHSDCIGAISFSPDGQLFASSSYDETVRIWETAAWTCRHTIKSPFLFPWSLSFSSDGLLAGSANDKEAIWLWDPATGLCRSILEGPTAFPAVIFSPDGQLIASGSLDGTVRLWETAARSHSSAPEGPSSVAWPVAFSPDGQLVASVSGDDTIQLWEVATGTCYSKLKHPCHVMATAFSPDGQLCASASHDGIVRVWEVATWKCLSTLIQYSKRPTMVGFSPDGHLVGLAFEDDIVKVWEVATALHHGTLEGHSSSAIGAPNYISASIPCWLQKQSSDIEYQGQWIVRNQQRILWIPPGLRWGGQVVHGNKICLEIESRGPIVIELL